MRLFVALDLPWALREALSGICGSLHGVRWVPPETYHLTLRFIGPVQRHVAEEIDLALSGLRGRALELSLRGVGTFERSRRAGSGPTTLWAGVECHGALDHLQGKIETALQRIGLPPERRRFLPHVTLAWIDQIAVPVLAGWLQAHNLLRTQSVPITRFTLFSSWPGLEQPLYTPEVDYELEPA